ncbi:tetratricopeptide repeat protein [Actinospica durhamensis]|uniref:Tetratricopeptide repeat protein n=1 Tax=Actinospica durhamensis TaxID=1508375 RepID=A0A941IW86_9ACTN|nr:helix-turn-helix domain-containing protein [Actinospica durhamensis]MBR7838766.1 tetratricopeptide repeat protein [Actinospica durhamensis]
MAVEDAAGRLARELRAAKDAAGLSLAQIGRHTHYSRASWERWLNGKRLIVPDALAGFAELTGTDGAHLAALLARATAERASGTGAQHRPDAASVVPPQHDASATLSPAPRRPAQLPPGVGDFTGRNTQIAALLEALVPRPDGQLGRPCVAVVCGGGGMGKTSLAVHVAHLAAAQYPDGALFANLDGAGRSPKDPAAVLGRWLAELGDGPEQIPESLEARSARFRSVVRDRALLVLLDNAGDAAQIRPLLPASERCGVLVTSRVQLAHLPAARHVQLEPMSYPEALSLLENVAGVRRVAREPKAAAAVLDACAGLPLALRICAARLETRPAWSVQTLAERVADVRRRLDELAVGDLATRSTFDMSYAQLAEDEPDAGPHAEQHAGPDASSRAAGARPGISRARAFRLLGLVSTPDLCLRAAAALFGVDEEQAEYVLESLVDVHLLESPAPERYRFHDLIRLYAAERAEQSEPPELRRAALERMLTWYTLTTDAAGHLVHPGRPWLPAPDLGVEPEPLADADAALAWYHLERANLLAAAELAEASGLYDFGWQLPHTMWPFFLMRSNRADWIAAAETGLRCAHALGDRTVEGRMRNSRAQALTELHRFDEAMLDYKVALEVATELGLEAQTAATLTSLCIVHWEAGHYDEAIAYGDQAVARNRASGSLRPLAGALNNLGHAMLRAGRHAEAERAGAEAVEIGREIDHGLIVADGLLIQAEARWRIDGRAEPAESWFREALKLSSGLGQLRNEAQTREFFGAFLLAQGRDEEAEELLTGCLKILEAMGHPRTAIVRTKLDRLRGSDGLTATQADADAGTGAALA